jgi:flagellar assembly protein FliH
MSSKVLPPGDRRPVAAWAWRQAREPRPAETGPPDPTAEYAHRLQELQAACEQRVREAHAAGIREGESRGRNQAAAELRPVLERLAHSVEETASLRPRLRREAETDLVRLSLAIARRILHRELAIDPHALRGVVMAAFERLNGQEVSRVRIHPDLAAPLTESLRALGGPSPPEVIADPLRDRGVLIFETSRGNLDASLETQLQEIERGLADRLRRNS